MHLATHTTTHTHHVFFHIDTAAQASVNRAKYADAASRSTQMHSGHNYTQHTSANTASWTQKLAHKHNQNSVHNKRNEYAGTTEFYTVATFVCLCPARLQYHKAKELLRKDFPPTVAEGRAKLSQHDPNKIFLETVSGIANTQHAHSNHRAYT